MKKIQIEKHCGIDFRWLFFESKFTSSTNQVTIKKGAKWTKSRLKIVIYKRQSLKTLFKVSESFTVRSR